MGLNKELSGTLVVSLEQAVAAPYCGLLLADAGARVIKVERQEGDFARGYDSGANGESTIFAWLNRGKESICLNLKTAGELSLLRAILNEADVLLSNLAPGAVARMGLDGEALRMENPGLITCSISGYGERGPAAEKKAYDFLVQAESGLCSVTGEQDAPARVGISITDISTGLTAFSAILRALIQRQKTGQGIDLKISMFDVMADWMNMPLLAHRYLGAEPRGTGLKHSLIAPYGAFECGDGGQVLLSVQSNREFKAFCADVLRQPELSQDIRFIDNTRRCTNRETLDAIITDVFAGFGTQDVIALLDGARIANARLNSVAALSKHPFLKNDIATNAGCDVTMAALPVQTNSGTPRDVPVLDQHGRSIRNEFTPKMSTKQAGS